MDQTLSSLEQFRDPTKWVVKQGVPFFREHVSTLPDGTPFPITPQELSRFAGELQRLEQREGVLARLTIGHTLAKDPKTGMEPRETEQPPIVGYARNARVGLFGPSQVPGIIGDFWYKAEHWNEAKEYPFRSPEVYLKSRQITGIALLKRDPKLDMGMTVFGRDNVPAMWIEPGKAYYQREDGIQFYAPDAEMDSYATPGAMPALSPTFGQQFGHNLSSGLSGTGGALTAGVGLGMLGSGKSLTNTVGNVGGGQLGAAAGGALGSALGPIGSAVGTIGGGLLGSMAGDKLTQDAEQEPPMMDAAPNAPQNANTGAEQAVDIDAVLAHCLQMAGCKTHYSRESNMSGLRGDQRTDYGWMDAVSGAGKAAGAGIAGGARAVGTGLGRATSALGATNAGAAMARNPGLTGGLALGGAGLGAFGLGRASKSDNAACNSGMKMMADETPPAKPEEAAGAAPPAPGGAAAPGGADGGAGGGGEELQAIAEAVGQMDDQSFANLLVTLTEMRKQASGQGPAAAPSPPAPSDEPNPMHRNNEDIARYMREVGQLQHQNQALLSRLSNLEQHAIGLEREKHIAQFHRELGEMDRLGYQVKDKDYERAQYMNREQFEMYKRDIAEDRERHHGSDQMIRLADQGTDAQLPDERGARSQHGRETDLATMFNRTDLVIDYMNKKHCEWEEADAAFDKNGRLKKPA